MAETVEHRILRSRKARPLRRSLIVELGVESQVEDRLGTRNPSKTSLLKVVGDQKGLPRPVGEEEVVVGKCPMLPEFPHIHRTPRELHCQPTDLPAFLYYTCPRILSSPKELYCSSRRAAWHQVRHQQCSSLEGLQTIWYGSPAAALLHETGSWFHPQPLGGLIAATPHFGWSNIIVTDKQTLVTDAGKLYVLDGLLKRLKEQGHRVLIYSQMTRMIDLLEEFMLHRKHTYMRLDGSSKISERRDMVADFQSREDIFVFLLSTRAGGLGINLTAADTVIFYDSDWNPTVDQQAMDRAHRLGQTKQVTVYRLICKGSIEERIMQRAREKSEIQRMVISGGNFKPDTLKPKEVVSLLLDDEEIEKKYRQKQAEKRTSEETRADIYRERDRERKRKQNLALIKNDVKKSRLDDLEEAMLSVDSAPVSPAASDVSQASAIHDETSNEGLVVDVDSLVSTQPQVFPSPFASNMLVTGRPRPTGRGAKRGRPRGSRRGGPSLGRGRGITVNITNTDLGLDPLPSDSGTFMTSLSSLHSPGAKRGPGRPRLRPMGPGHQGIRGSPRPRKAPKPLPVPLRTGSGTPSSHPASKDQQKPFGFYTQGASDNE